MTKPNAAQLAKLATVPDDWATIPILGDYRPIPPLIRMGLIEVREVDRTPEGSSIRFINRQWRLTGAGRSVVKVKGQP